MPKESSRSCSVIVNGDSMWPTLSDGDEVICDLSSYDDNKPVVGDIVLSVHPLKSSVKVVKRIFSIDSEGRVFLKGDNPDPIASTDSHAFGKVEQRQILGRILLSNK